MLHAWSVQGVTLLCRPELASCLLHKVVCIHRWIPGCSRARVMTLVSASSCQMYIGTHKQENQTKGRQVVIGVQHICLSQNRFCCSVCLCFAWYIACALV